MNSWCTRVRAHEGGVHVNVSGYHYHEEVVGEVIEPRAIVYCQVPVYKQDDLSVDVNKVGTPGAADCYIAAGSVPIITAISHGGGVVNNTGGNGSIRR